ncbi:MAG: hypothetical protein J5I98_16875 [Phaeodactylibacter sp.]|nr:hypothetical protein [Phaeodactylibacter sp.]
MPAEGERYVAYRVKLTSYWFGPWNSDEEQKNAFNKLYQLRNDPALEPHKKYIFVSSLYLTKGKPISLSSFPELRSGGHLHIVSPEKLAELEKDLENSFRKLEQFELSEFPKDLSELEGLEKVRGAVEAIALDKGAQKKMKNLREQYGDEKTDDPPGPSKKGNGLEGPFPVSYSFSKWFAVLVDVFTDIIDCTFFGCQMKDKVEKILTLAYMIMPEVMDRIASSIAKLQDEITPDELDTAMNHITDVTKYAYMIYQDLKKLKNLVENPDFQSLLNELDLSDAIKHLNRYGLNIGNINKYCEYIPCDCIKSLASNIQDDGRCIKEIKEKARKKIEEEVFKQADKYLKKSSIPVLKHMNVGAFRQLAEDKDWEKFTRNQVQSMACPYVPAAYRGDCKDFIAGNYEDAALSAVGTTVQERAKLSKEHFECTLRNLKNKDYKEALKCAKNIPRDYYPEYFKEYESVINDLIDNPDEEGARKAVETLVDNFVDKDIIKEAIGAGAYLLEKAQSGERIDLERMIPTLANAVQRKTGISAAKIEAALGALKAENHARALQIAADAALDKYGSYFGRYQSSVRAIINSGNQEEIKKALEVFLDNAIENDMIKNAIGTGAFVLDQAIQGEKVEVKKLLEEGLSRLGFEYSQVQQLLNGEFQLDQKQLMADFAQEMRITSREAIEALQALDFDRAIDLQLEGLKKEEFKQADYIRQRFKNKKEMMEVLQKVLNKQLEDRNYAQGVLYERKLQNSK